MLDLKAKLLAAGLVTVDQVKKVEDDEAQRKVRDSEARAAREQAKLARDQHRTSRARPAAADERPDFVRAPKPKREDRPRKDPNDPDEKAAKKEHELVEAERWRARLDELKGAGKATQYEAVRGWIARFRLDSKHITEAAERFHFVKMDGALSHLTVEPDVIAQLAGGEAALVAYMGFNGIEHTVVPKQIALEIHVVKPEWLRALVGVTDQAPPAADSNAHDANAVGADVATDGSVEPSAG